MNKIHLKEHIGLKNYCWENCLLTYKINKKPDGNTLLLVGTGEKIPSQIKDVGNGEYSISFVTGLKSGEEKEYALINVGEQYKNICTNDSGAVVMENANIRVVINSSTQELFSIYGNFGDVCGTSVLSQPIVNKHVEVFENGPVFAKTRILSEFENGDSYEIELTLAREQDFVRIYEKINTNDQVMEILWQGFKPVKRVSSGMRGKQYVNEYLKPNNELPIVLLPHDVTSGVVEIPSIAFFNKECSVGAFIGDSIKWNDGCYSIQSNNKTNALRFYCYEDDDNKLVWKYPLNKGSRDTCIALYKSEDDYDTALKSHIRELQFWNYYLPLDLYKDWVFEYDDKDEKYPKYFDKEKFDCEQAYYWPGNETEGIPPANEVLDRIINTEIIQEPWRFGPVKSRVFGEIIPLLDLRANEMSREDFVRCRNICILFAYIAMNENIFPTRHTLAGHANFFMDYVAVEGLAAAMFPKHPDAEKWKSYYHRAVLLNMKFYVRPDVKTWKAKGGRFCENLGCYSWACLRHILSTGEMIESTFGDNPVLHKNFEKWADWFLNSLSAPINGKRAFPPLGAHAGGHILNPFYPPFWFRLMGRILKNYSPLLAEQILSVCPDKPLIQFEAFKKNDVWSYMNKNTDVENTGIRPHLKSEKFTGYGYIMRSHVNEANEMCVFLQQLDEGPNYRWGSSCSGGCGNIYYYADNKRFSDNRKEDVGDDVMSDGDVSCTFSVLQNHTYKSVGKNELTYPLSDFGFCQYARVNACDYSDDEYRFRSVLMADDDYIAIYDAVRDFRTQGRFSWFSNVNDDMPYIHQLKPGLLPRVVNCPDLTVTGDRCDVGIACMENPPKTRGVMYDGRGDFFTIVTHKNDLEVSSLEFGAVIKKNDSTDYVFDVPYSVNVSCDMTEFDGKVGFVRVYNKNEYDMAIIDAKSIKVFDTQIKVDKMTKNFSISLSRRAGRLFGKCVGCAKVHIIEDSISDYKLYINSEQVELKTGSAIELKDCEWELTNAMPSPSEIENISYFENQKGVTINWSGKNCSEYVVKVGKAIYVTKQSSIDLKLDKGKYIVTICGKNDNLYGNESIEYPMYITKTVPSRIEGVLVTRHNEFMEVSWGSQLGVKVYNLYRTDADGDTRKIYSGTSTVYRDEIQTDKVKYFVAAENGIGESEPSVTRDTISGGMSDWDPVPDIEFIRDTINNEHGFPGFDYNYNENRKILKYPS